MYAPMHTRLAHAAAVVLATGALMATGLVAPAHAQPVVQPGHGLGDGHDKGHCRAFQARGEGTDNGNGTTSATIYRGNREIGTTTGTITPVAVADAVLSFAGSIVFTNDQGTLTAPVEGTFDTASGEVAASSSSVTGTAGFAEVTGTLRIRGVQDVTAGTFTERLRAKLCVPKKHPH